MLGTVFFISTKKVSLIALFALWRYSPLSGAGAVEGHTVRPARGARRAVQTMYGPGVYAKREASAAQKRRRDKLSGVGETARMRDKRLYAVYGKTRDELARSCDVSAQRRQCRAHSCGAPATWRVRGNRTPCVCARVREHTTNASIFPLPCSSLACSNV